MVHGDRQDTKMNKKVKEHMVKRNEIYKCDVCGNVVSVVEEHIGKLVCCNKEMKLIEEIGAEHEGKEKHVPVMEIDGETVKVTVGIVHHPMEESHYIELIQLVKNGEVIQEKVLRPSDEPIAEFCNVKDTSNISARAYCNLHGLWKN